MSKIRTFFQRFQLHYRPTHPLSKAAVTVAIVFCTVTMIALLVAHQNNLNKLAYMQDQAARLELENQELTDRVEGLGTVDSIRQIAEEELGLVDPDSIIIEESE